MGSGHSSRRNGQRHQGTALARPVHPPWMPPPPGYSDANYSPYYYHHPQPVSPHIFQQGYYMPANGHFYPNPGYRPALPLESSPVVHEIPAVHTVPEYQKANTVRNDVNLNKGTLRLERNEVNPGQHVVAFSFDATAAGSISVFFMAQEGADGSVTSLSASLPQPGRSHFKNGLGQKFKQESGLDFSLIDENDLSRASKNVYPLIIRIETVPKDPPAHAQDPEPVGGPLRKWIHCQQTYATIEKKDDGEYHVKVVKQIIWVDGVRYELQEIYGIANSELNSSSDSGKECVICMSEPKDTTVLPCRHMCMCSGCANVLRYQTNLCPICRCPVEELLQIKVPAS